MTKYQYQNGGKKNKGQQSGKLVKSGFQATRSRPQGQVLLHFGMHIWCLSSGLLPQVPR